MSEYLMKPTVIPKPQGVTETVTGKSNRENLSHVSSCSIPNALFLSNRNEAIKNQVAQPMSGSGAFFTNQISSSSDYRNAAALPTGQSSSYQIHNRETLMVNNSSKNCNARRNNTSDNNVFKDSYCKAPKLFETNETAIMSGAVGILTAAGSGYNNDDLAYYGDDPTVDLLAILGMQRVPTPSILYVPPKPVDPADYEAVKRQREALEKHPRFTPTLELQMDMKDFKRELKM